MKIKQSFRKSGFFGILQLTGTFRRLVFTIMVILSQDAVYGSKKPDPMVTCRVETIPQGAEVCIDGFFTGETPVIWSGIPGRHSLEFRFRGETFLREVMPSYSGTGSDTIDLGPFFLETSDAGDENRSDIPELFPELSDPFPYLLPGSDEYPTSPDRSAKYGTPEIDTAMKLFEEKSFDESLTAWRLVATALPGFADVAFLYAGLSLCGLGRLDAAKMEFSRILDEFPDSPSVGSALYGVARCELALGLTDDGLGKLSVLVEDYPGIPEISNARRLLDSNGRFLNRIRIHPSPPIENACSGS